MRISQEELNRRLSSNKNLSRFSARTPEVSKPAGIRQAPISSPSEEIVPLPPSKKEYNKSASVEQRVQAAVDVNSGLSVREAAIKNGMTPNQVFGARHSHDYEVTSRTETNLERAREMALDKMIQALGLIDEEKLSNAKLGELSNTAMNLSRIVERTGAKETKREDSVKLIIYAPQQREMKDFKFIDV